MKQSHSELIPADASNIFAAYENITSWPEWDHEVADVMLDRGLVVGSVGWLKPRSGPKASIKVVEVTAAKSFEIQSKLPLCTMCVKHTLESKGSHTLATHSVEFEGALAFLFRRLIGKSLTDGFPKSLRGLAEYVES